jgi:hypothetical protein
MSNLIKVTENEISSLEFVVKSVSKEIENYETFYYPTYDSEETIRYQRNVWGRVEWSSTTQFNGETLSLYLTYDAEGRHGSYKDSFDFSVQIHDDGDSGANFVIVYEEGDEMELNAYELLEYARSYEDIETAVLQSSVLPEIEEAETLEGNVTEAEDAKEFIVERDNNTDLIFTGKILAYETSKENYQHGRWFDLTLYQAVNGKYICQKEEISTWNGERNRYIAEVCETIECVKEFFGYGWVSKRLYEKAAIKFTETVE